MQVGIIGGAGFIGTALTRALLDEGLNVRVLDTERRIRRSLSLLEGATLVAYDFSVDAGVDRKLEKLDALVHLSCTTSPSRSMESIVSDAVSNIIPSIQIFESAKRQGIEKVLFASSGGTVYGKPTSLPVLEDHSLHPISSYGVSKLAVEQYLSLYSEFVGISLRIANPYGTYQFNGTAVGVIARFMQLVHMGKPIEVWGDGSITRDYIHIDDVVSAFVFALREKNVQSGQYNIGTGLGYSVRDVISLIESVTGKNVNVRFCEGRPYDVPAITLNSARFTCGTGWVPKTDLYLGIRELWDYLCHADSRVISR